MLLFHFQNLEKKSKRKLVSIGIFFFWLLLLTWFLDSFFRWFFHIILLHYILSKLRYFDYIFNLFIHSNLTTNFNTPTFWIVLSMIAPSTWSHLFMCVSLGDTSSLYVSQHEEFQVKLFGQNDIRCNRTITTSYTKYTQYTQTDSTDTNGHSLKTFPFTFMQLLFSTKTEPSFFFVCSVSLYTTMISAISSVA